MFRGTYQSSENPRWDKKKSKEWKALRSTRNGKSSSCLLKKEKAESNRYKQGWGELRLYGYNSYNNFDGLISREVSRYVCVQNVGNSESETVSLARRLRIRWTEKRAVNYTSDKYWSKTKLVGSMSEYKHIENHCTLYHGSPFRRDFQWSSIVKYASIFFYIKSILP